MRAASFPLLQHQGHQAVSPLLVFRDAPQEAAATVVLHQSLVIRDSHISAFGVLCHVLLGLRFALSQGWSPAMASTALSILVGTLVGWLSYRRHAFFMRHRSLVVGLFYTFHSLVSDQHFCSNIRYALRHLARPPACPHACTPARPFAASRTGHEAPIQGHVMLPLRPFPTLRPTGLLASA